MNHELVLITIAILDKMTEGKLTEYNCYEALLALGWTPTQAGNLMLVAKLAA